MQICTCASVLPSRSFVVPPENLTGLSTVPACMTNQIAAFLRLVENNVGLRAQVEQCATADEVALIAQGLGYTFAGDDLKRIGKSGGVRVRRLEMPGEYPDRY
eukprot:g83304.t1